MRVAISVWDVMNGLNVLKLFIFLGKSLESLHDVIVIFEEHQCIRLSATPIWRQSQIDCCNVLHIDDSGTKRVSSGEFAREPFDRTYAFDSTQYSVVYYFPFTRKVASFPGCVGSFWAGDAVARLRETEPAAIEIRVGQNRFCRVLQFGKKHHALQRSYAVYVVR